MAYDILHSLAFVDNQNIAWAVIAKTVMMVERMSAADRECWSVGSENERSGDDDKNKDQDEDEDHANVDRVRIATVLLQEFSFLRLRASDERQAYEMHKLAQEATRHSLAHKDRRKEERCFSEVALCVIAALFPASEREAWAECERYLVHAQRVADWARLCRCSVEAANLLSRVSDYLYDRGRWREREPVDERAYEFRKALRISNPLTAMSE